MSLSDLPIGVFDSGLGGLSVLQALRCRMPRESYIYFGDSANAPYGVKSHDEIFALTMDAAEKLINRGIKALVVACNTATSIAINALRERYSEIPIIGLEPALKPAVEHSRGGRIIVMATPATLTEPKFRNLLAKYGGTHDISLLPAPGLVEEVEKGKFRTGELYSMLGDLFAPFDLKTIESIVLGCTHFPFAAEEILETVGSGVRLYDGGSGAAAETERRLAALGLLSEGGGDLTIINSLGTKEIYDLSYMLLEKRIPY